GDAVLSEEGRDDPARLTAARVWIVDPLDGTREFGEPPRTDWAVHVALVVAGRPVAGAVALPALGLTLGTRPAPSPLPPLPASPYTPRVIVSRSRPPAAATWLAEHLGGELVPMGSAGAKAMAVVRGEADVYAHSGGQFEWDSCAPVAVAAAAGLHVSRLDGSPLRYNNADPYLPDLLICRRELADASLQALAAFEG
ncbi:MAG TPA: 3'(2'),5'-bisphosphate nucleotidase CysQ, partial [Acidimicrobiales bacterium]